jgi:ADP-ribosylglycohydrolase
MMGLAVGDALGMPVEFCPVDTTDPIREMRPAVRFDRISRKEIELPAGAWTDDTSMALCLADSILTLGSFNSEDQLQRYLKWFRSGYLSAIDQCFGIGPTVRGVLEAFESGAHSPGDPTATTNGALMRVSPVGLAYCADSVKAIELSGESSRTTHKSRESVDACRYMGSLLVGVVNGVRKDELLSPFFFPGSSRGYWDATPLCPEIARIAAGSFKLKKPPEINGANEAASTLEAALWAFWESDNFANGCTMAVMLGLDTDTTAAVFGAIAGAYYGIDEIPTEWKSAIAKHDIVMEYAERLHSFSLALESNYRALV